MRYEWHEEKRRINLRDHGVDFAHLPVVFDAQPDYPYIEDCIDPETGEQRWNALIRFYSVELIVCHVYRSEDDEQETICRFISARKIGARERQRRFDA